MKNITAYEGTEKVIFTCVLQDTGDQQMVGRYFFLFRLYSQMIMNLK